MIPSKSPVQSSIVKVSARLRVLWALYILRSGRVVMVDHEEKGPSSCGTRDRFLAYILKEQILFIVFGGGEGGSWSVWGRILRPHSR